MHAEEVIDKVIEFVKSKGGYPFVQLGKVAFDKKTLEWEVTVNVGALSENIKKVKVNDKDGKIIGFE